MEIKILEDVVLSKVFFIRRQKAIIDEDYQVETKRLNEQVKRNQDRFPVDFAFQLSTEEYDNLKSQIATSSSLLKILRFCSVNYTPSYKGKKLEVLICHLLSSY